MGPEVDPKLFPFRKVGAQSHGFCDRLFVPSMIGTRLCQNGRVPWSMKLFGWNFILVDTLFYRRQKHLGFLGLSLSRWEGKPGNSLQCSGWLNYAAYLETSKPSTAVSWQSRVPKGGFCWLWIRNKTRTNVSLVPRISRWEKLQETLCLESDTMVSLYTPIHPLNQIMGFLHLSPFQRWT